MVTPNEWHLSEADPTVNGALVSHGVRYLVGSNRRPGGGVGSVSFSGRCRQCRSSVSTVLPLLRLRWLVVESCLSAPLMWSGGDRVRHPGTLDRHLLDRHAVLIASPLIGSVTDRSMRCLGIDGNAADLAAMEGQTSDHAV